MAAAARKSGSRFAALTAVISLTAASAACVSTETPMSMSMSGTGGQGRGGGGGGGGSPAGTGGTGGSTSGAGGSGGTAGVGSGTGGAGGVTGSGGAGGASSVDAPPSQGDGGPGPVDGSASVDASAPTGVVKIMVMGSSNEVRTCWRAFLWKKLRDAGITNFDFVGSMTDGPDCGVAGYDRHDESRSGTVVSEITAAQYAMRFKANPPDIVLVHFGGADILQGIAPAKVIPGYTLMVEQGRAVNPRIRFLVGEHTPMTPASCAKCPMTVPELNAATVAWAKTITTPTAPVTTVDLFNGLDAATDTSDRVHLNDAGSQKVAEKFAAALIPIFKP